MQKDFTDITILCKVVDNFGDIGVTYRLSRALLDVQNAHPELLGKINIRLVVDNLDSFAKIVPEIKTDSAFQEYKGIKIFDWNANDFCKKEFEQNEPFIILECFQCGRPDWLEDLLFVKEVSHVVNIIMIDYLSAEDYAENFHKLMSLTRSARVQKVNFMPGFTNKTGGLIQDKSFMDSLSLSLKSLKTNTDEPFNVLFFSYEGDWNFAVKALSRFNNGNINVLAAQGRGLSSFVDSWQKLGKPFLLQKLEYLCQEEWDALMCKTPLLFIRGEDSLSRACLIGHPFVWHAYPQSDEYQMVKVNALLDRMKEFFSPEDFEAVKNCWLTYNGEKGDKEKALTCFLERYTSLCTGFKLFADNTIKNGDLAFNLMTFIKKNYIL